MRQVLSSIFAAGYYLVCASVVLRALMMLVAYIRSASDGRKKAGVSLLLSCIVECSWCALVGLSFNVSRVDLIPLVLSGAGLSMLRRIAPFERVGSQHVYSLLASMLPQKQAVLARLTAMHIF